MFNKTEQEIIKNWQGDISLPVVSICSITYNHESYIEEAIDSFLMQETDFPFEIVVGEDYSTDGTRQIIEEYLEQYPNIIKLITSDNNVGPNRNFMRTLNACTGKYIAICEGDDYWIDDKKLKIQKRFLDNNKDFSLCYHNFYIKRKDTIIQNNDKQSDDMLTFETYAKNLPNIQTLTTMFRNDILEIIPENLLDKVKGSHFLFLRMSEFGKLKYIDKYMGMYRIHEGGVWSKKNQFKKGITALENMDVMISYFLNNNLIQKSLEYNYNCKAFYYASFFLSRFKFNKTFYFLKKLKNSSLQSCYKNYFLDLNKAIKNRITKK
jgi:glycosyltransferase involved in cell wall biosynthesis